MNNVVRYLGNTIKGLRHEGTYPMIKLSNNGNPIVLNDELEAVELVDFQYITNDSISFNDIEKPSHYVSENIQCIDAMKEGLGESVAADFCIGNAFKYIWRHKKKEDPIKDIKKAIKYLQMYVEFLEKEIK